MGADRLAIGAAFEQSVMEKLRALGYKTCEFGQGLLPPDIREGLQALTTRPPLRWVPDLLVLGGKTGRLVDAKTGRVDTGFWCIEAEAHQAHRWQQLALGFEIVYVFPDFTCAFVDDLPDRKLSVGAFKGSGSGTPFWLVPKKHTQPWDNVFPRFPAHGYAPRRITDLTARRRRMT